MYDPNWPTTMRPLGSVIMGNSSCCSRITGDIAVRYRTASISKRQFFKALSMMSSVTGSTSIEGTAAIFTSRMTRLRLGLGGGAAPVAPGASALRPDDEIKVPVHLGV